MLYNNKVVITTTAIFMIAIGISYTQVEAITVDCVVLSKQITRDNSDHLITPQQKLDDLNNYALNCQGIKQGGDAQ